MKKGVCKYYNGNHEHARCLAGIAYSLVTTEPERLEGSAFRKPCVQWDRILALEHRAPLAPRQAQEWARHGHCDIFCEPTDQEIADFKLIE